MRYTVFGESHGSAVGVVLEGVPSGVELDWDFIRSELRRRAPGQNATSTARREADEPEVLSGVFEGRTTGTPLCAVIRNTDTRSRDYRKLQDLPRPGHADYTGQVRYGGYNDYRGGGHFSGRLTAPLVLAGAALFCFRIRPVWRGRKSSGRKERTGANFSGDRSTSIRGWTMAPRIFREN